MNVLSVCGETGTSLSAGELVVNGNNHLSSESSHFRRETQTLKT